MPGLKLYDGLCESKRPEVISRLMQGQMNFLPLRTGTIHCAAALCSLLWSSSATVGTIRKPGLMGFPHNPATVTVWFRLPTPGWWYLMCVFVCT